MRRLVFYNLLLIIAFIVVSCSKSFYVTDVSMQNNPVEIGLAKNDTVLVQLYQPYKKNLDKDMSRIIGVTDAMMEKNKPESGLTNFLADLLLEEANNYLSDEDFKADISFFNYGGIRTFLPKGEIAVRNIYELMPFENEMVFLKLKGKDLKLFLDRIAEGGGDSVGGVRFKIGNDEAEDIKIGGKEFNMDSEYWLVTNDYIAGGGDGLEMFLNRTQYYTSGLLIRSIIINYIEKLHNKGIVISPKTDGRIRINE